MAVLCILWACSLNYDILFKKYITVSQYIELQFMYHEHVVSADS